MSIMLGFGAVPSPTHPPMELLSHDAEARAVLASLIDALLDRAVSAGWDRRTAASALMFHAAAQVADMSRSGRQQRSRASPLAGSARSIAKRSSAVVRGNAARSARDSHHAERSRRTR